MQCVSGCRPTEDHAREGTDCAADDPQAPRAAGTRPADGPLVLAMPPLAPLRRIGYLSPSWFALHTRTREAFVHALRARLGGGPEPGHRVPVRGWGGMSASPPSPRSWSSSRSTCFCPECPRDPGGPAGDDDDPHCHGYLGDPVQTRVCRWAGAARRNITGTAASAPSWGKQLELLQVAVPTSPRWPSSSSPPIPWCPTSARNHVGSTGLGRARAPRGASGQRLGPRVGRADA